MKEKSRKRKLTLALAALMLLLCVLQLPVWATEEEESENAAVESGVAESEENPAEAALLRPTVKETPDPLSDSREDVNFIIVEKHFIGLSEQEIPDSFQITVSSHGASYVLNQSNVMLSQESGTELVWRWKLSGVGIGSYSVSEENAAVEGYTLAKQGEGDVELRAAEITVSTPVHETTCSHNNWPVRVEGNNNVLFAATLTQGGVAVISKMPLSASQREAVAEAVLQIKGPWKNPVYFYSIEEQLRSGKSFELNGATISYKAETEEIIIDRTSNWQHVATCTYDLTEANNPELVLTNRYERRLSSLTVTKTVRGSLGDYEKSFDFSVEVKLNGEGAAFRIGNTDYTGRADFSLRHGESITLTELPVGASVTVSESNPAEKGYAALTVVDGGEERTGNVVSIESTTAKGHTILFYNDKDAVPDTGISLDSLPYVLILCAVFSLAALMLRTKRREAK